MYSLIRPLLFSLDTETAHALTLQALHYVPAACFPKVSVQNMRVMGIEFPHRVGLAAGLDKNGEHLDALAKLGFAFIEVGTVTPRPQTGNPKPRLFRIPKANALINRMGFNNHGVDVLVSNIQRAHYRGVVGINIGKNKDTILNHAADDYLHCLRKVYPVASYVAINISSPNTPDLRQLQQEGYFANLIESLHVERLRLADRYQRYVPLVVKISPDEPPETLKRIASEALACSIDGIIATNTTCERDNVQEYPYANEQGGLSGLPLFEPSTACLRLLKQVVGDDVTLIGVGGIDNVSRARAKIAAGASLLQIYTGLVYQGPHLVKRLADGLVGAVDNSSI